MWERGRLEEGIENMQRSFEVLSQEEPDEDLATLAAQLGRFMFFGGQYEVAAQRIETALDLAEALLLPEVLSQALNTKAVMLQSRGRRTEAAILVRHALELALEQDKPSAALRAYNNVGDMLVQGDRYEEADQVLAEGIEYARRLGNRQWERSLLGQVYAAFALGKWDAVLEHVPELLAEGVAAARVPLSAMFGSAVAVHVHRGELQEAEKFVGELLELATSADAQERGAYAAGKALLLLATGNPAEALPLAREGLALREAVGLNTEYTKELFVVALDAAVALGELRAGRGACWRSSRGFRPGSSSQFLQAQVSRFRARLAAGRAETEEADRRFKRATGLFREIAAQFYLAVTQLEHGEWLTGQGRADEAEPLLAEARETFERLGRRAMARAGRLRRRGVVARMTCGSCGTENRPGRKFCAELRRER